jgi:peptidoglycan/LPS O-acetylase OafA/YrhL
MTTRFVQLDALRFVFALVVALGHSVGFGLTLIHGSYAVDFFFILSGFVLSHALIARPVSVGEFAWARFARLYPLHLLTLLWMIGPVSRAGGDPSSTGTALLLNVFLLHGLGFGAGYAWNFPSWSISIELIVNVILLYPIIRLRSILAGLTAVALSFAVILFAWGPIYDHFGPDVWAAPFISGALLRGTASIILGYLLYEAYLYLYPRLDRVRLVHLATTFESAALALLLFCMWTDNFYCNLAPVPLSALLILQMAVLPGRLSTILQNRVFRALGDISYSVYLIHLPLFLVFLTAGLLPFPGTVFSPVWFLYLAVLLFVSAASFRYIERPAQRALMRLSGHKSTTITPSRAHDAEVRPPLH